MGVYIRQFLLTQRGKLSLNGYVCLNNFLIFNNSSAIFLDQMVRIFKIFCAFLLLLIFTIFKY